MLLVLITIKILVGMSVVFVIFEACVVASGVWFFPYYATLPQLAMMISYMHNFRLTYQDGILDKQTTIELIQDKSIIK